MNLFASILKYSVKLFYLPSKILHTLRYAAKFGMESVRIGSFTDSIKHLPSHISFRLRFGAEKHASLSETSVESMVAKTTLAKRSGNIPGAEDIPEKALVESAISFIGTSYWYFPDTAGRIIRKGSAKYKELSDEV